MRPQCFLVSGTVEIARKTQEDFSKYLTSIGCETQHVEISPNPFSIPLAMLRNVQRLSSEQTFLIAYTGHGHLMGWECRGLMLNYYRLLALVVSRVKGDLMIINDTCFGLHFLNHIKKFRSPENTCFISPWDSKGPSYGGPVRDALEYWPKGIVVEDYIGENWDSTEKGDFKVPIQLRWGAQLDHLFFPA